jgi:hypothetical protein
VTSTAARWLHIRHTKKLKRGPKILSLAIENVWLQCQKFCLKSAEDRPKNMFYKVSLLLDDILHNSSYFDENLCDCLYYIIYDQF